MVDNKTSFVAGDLEMTPFQAVIIPILKGGDTLLLFFFEGFCCQGRMAECQAVLAAGSELDHSSVRGAP